MHPTPELLRTVIERHGGQMSTPQLNRVTGLTFISLMELVDGVNVASVSIRPSERGRGVMYFYVPELKES